MYYLITLSAKGLDQYADRSTELCVFPPSKFIKWQTVFYSFSWEKLEIPFFNERFYKFRKNQAELMYGMQLYSQEN